MNNHNVHIQKYLIPEPTLRRIPWYLSCISNLSAQGIEFVSSTAIAKEINVDPSQIAKDLSYLNIKGKTRIGYEVRQLETELKDFLGFNRRHKAVMIGVGSLGAALIADSGLQRYGLDIVAGFDIDPAVIGTVISDVPIYDMKRLQSLREPLQAEIGVIAVPPAAAQAAADSLVQAGILALWNFTPFRIRPHDGAVIQNTSIYADLAVMYNRIDSTR